MAFEMVKIGEISTQIRGVTYSKDDASNKPKADYLPILRANNIQENRLVFDDLVFVPKSKISEKQHLKKGDVLIATSSGSLEVVGKAGSVNENLQMAFGAFCKVLRPKTTLVNERYFANYFSTKFYRHTVSKLAEGANINNLKNEHLDNLEIPLPPLPTQIHIAKILDKADELRQNRKIAIAKLDELLQATFVKMFGDPVVNDKGWDKDNLKNLAKVFTGKTPPSKNENMFDGDIPFITPSDLGDYIYNYNRTITEDGAKFSKIVPKNTTLVCCIGATIGKMGFLKKDSAFNQQINSITWLDKIEPFFGYQMMRFFSKEITQKGQSTTLPILKKSEFEKIAVIIPPLELQTQFAQIAQNIESQKSKFQAQLTQLDTLFLALEQKAFDGGFSHELSA